MLICPNCNKELNTTNYCDNCSYTVQADDEYYNSSGLDILYKFEEKHFWFKVRKNVILDAFTRFINKNENILEIGAGTGNISRMLLSNGYSNVSVGDIHKKGLEYAKSYGIQNRHLLDVTQMPFKEHFDVIGLFDVLEHISEDSLVIRNIHKSLKEKGKFILTVPAHMWLWSKGADQSHKKRYELFEIKELLESNNFKILKAKNFFLSILPLLYLRKLLDKLDNNRQEQKQLTGLEINSFINEILYYVTNLENVLLRCFSPKVGGSIIAVAEKA